MHSYGEASTRYGCLEESVRFEHQDDLVNDFGDGVLRQVDNQVGALWLFVRIV